MPRTFYESLVAHTNKPPHAKLPFCHVDSFDVIIGHVQKGSLTAVEQCDVFKRWLSYLFYGRAIYRPKDRGAPDASCLQPAALIFKPNVLQHVYTLYPFDTGGYQYYGAGKGTHKLEDFSIIPQTHECERIVERHWRTAKDYAFAEHANFIQHRDVDCLAVEGYSQIVINSPKADTRRSCVEISFEGPLAIDHSTLAGVVVPGSYATAKELQDLAVHAVPIEKYWYCYSDQSHAMTACTERATDIVTAFV